MVSLSAVFTSQFIIIVDIYISIVTVIVHRFVISVDIIGLKNNL